MRIIHFKKINQFYGLHFYDKIAGYTITYSSVIYSIPIFAQCQSNVLRLKVIA